MFRGKKVLVVVPARCGSKGVKLKNARRLGGEALVTLVGHIVKKLPFVDQAIVSTDCSEVANMAKKGGLEVPFMRPKDLSGDIVSDLQVLTHALLASEDQYGAQYDIVCMLQPTCPLRKPEHVEECIKELVQKELDSVWTVSETDSKSHPLKQLVVTEDGDMSYYDKRGVAIIARQQLSPLYHRNGAAYAITRECLLKKKSIKGDSSGAVILTDQLVNIDTLQDLDYCEFLFETCSMD